MSIKEAKLEIINMLDEISEDAIFKLLGLMQELRQVNQTDVDATAHLLHIMQEDDDLLNRLAQ